MRAGIQCSLNGYRRHGSKHSLFLLECKLEKRMGKKKKGDPAALKALSDRVHQTGVLEQPCMLNYNSASVYRACLLASSTRHGHCHS